MLHTLFDQLASRQKAWKKFIMCFKMLYQKRTCFLWSLLVLVIFC